MILEHLSTPGIKHNVVIFHHPCQDGWMSAVIARKHFGDGGVIYEGRNYDQPFDPAMLPVYTGKYVFILDFSMPLEDLKKIALVAKRVYVFDHHKSFTEILGCQGAIEHEETRDNLHIHYQSKLCGAQMVWNYFNDPAEEPMLVSYVADRDLWMWDLDGSREVSAALHIEERTFDRWLELLEDFESPSVVEMYAEHGAAILRAQTVEVDKLARRAYFRQYLLNSYIPTCNTQSFQSEVCERMLQLYPTAPFAAAYFDKDASTRIWSLRSRKGSDVDVSAICKANGGGGHENAAGYTEKI